MNSKKDNLLWVTIRLPILFVDSLALGVVYGEIQISRRQLFNRYILHGFKGDILPEYLLQDDLKALECNVA